MHKFFGPFFSGRAAAGLLVIRVLFGIGMVEHGYQKYLAGVLHWADNMATMSPPLVIPPFFQGMAAFCEFFGGLSMIFGLLTPLGMVGIFCTMTFALVKFHFPRGEVYIGGFGKPDYEAAAHFWIVAVGLFFVGPGKWSLDALIFGRRHGAPYTP